ncbi:MAG: RagB/SusD family nutrient uptake outer membrane protein [Bacteroidales bacterium]
MKSYILYLVGLSYILTLSSCNEWLKVMPEGQVPAEEMFESEQGFKDALNGVYIAMKSEQTYGKQLSMSTIEHLVSSWDVEEATTPEYLNKFNYGDAKVERNIENIFQHQYFTISEINAILMELDIKQDMFTTEGLYAQIKGECLGLRAYIHFDILRMFGPVPNTETGDDILPYATTISKDNHPYINYGEYKKTLEKDMIAADTLLTDAEQHGNYSFMSPLRMNAEATKALQARVALWFGEKNKAYELASNIIASTERTLGKATDFAGGNYNLTGEQFFGIHNYDMYNLYTSTFGNQTLKKGTNTIIVNTELYGNTGSDIRETMLWETNTSENGTSAYSIIKYKVSDNAPSSLNGDYRRVPLIRLSEMYLIAIETATDIAKGQQYWDDFRASRNLSPAPLPNDAELVKIELIKEYRKEFFAEGQAFYAYKRLNVGKDNFLWLPPEVKEIKYVVPIPISEPYAK